MKTSRPARPTPAVAVARPEQRREEILDRAIDLFAAHGFAATDLQVLADDLGIGKGTLYRHFGNKEKLFLAAADRVMHKLRLHVDAYVAGVTDPLANITRGIHGYLEFFNAHPAAVEMLIQERAHFKDRKRPTYFEHREANIGRWRAIYRDLIAQGRLRPLSVERMSDTIGDLLYGTMFVSYIAGRRLQPAQAAAEIIDIVFHGILTDMERQAQPAQD